MKAETMDFDHMKRILAQLAKKVEDFTRDYYETQTAIPAQLLEAMTYSLNAGGKRLRPSLCLVWAQMTGGKEVTPFAAAIEMIHTYSLIHDDLPAMDNDDMRRGKPANHKAFGEAAAILAGDGLLSEAFAIALQTKVSPENLLPALSTLARACGPAGMVGGQMLDIVYTSENGVTSEQLAQMQALKTGAMFEASCVCGAILASAEQTMVMAAGAYGASLGRAFQIMDDILDVTGDSASLGKPAGSDMAMGKITWPALVGLAESRKLAQLAAFQAIEALASFSCEEASFLRSVAQYAIDRSF